MANAAESRPFAEGVTRTVRPAWVLVTPAEDLPGAWTAHVLELDLVTVGDSVEDAFDMALDAVRLVVESDTEKGLDPFDRKPAPPEYWEPLAHLLNDRGRARLGDLNEEQRKRVVVAAAQIAVEHDGASLPQMEPWRMAQLNEQQRDSCRPS